VEQDKNQWKTSYDVFHKRFGGRNKESGQDVWTKNCKASLQPCFSTR
jgi:hypothetical protein